MAQGATHRIAFERELSCKHSASTRLGMGKVCSLLSGRDVQANIEQTLEKATGVDAGQTFAPAGQAALKQVKLEGSKRSLLIGINYRGTGNELHGCVNDVRRMLPVLEQ